MKKNLLLLFVGVIFPFALYGQLDTTGYVNYLKNGDFEEQGAWKIAVTDGDTSDVTWEFGVFPGPAYGEDACLETSWDNVGTPLNQILYQVVELTVGDTYWFDGALWDAGTAANINQAWFQIIIFPVKGDIDGDINTGITGPGWQDNDAIILLNHAMGWGYEWLALGKNTTFVEDMNPDFIYGNNVGIGDFDGQGDTMVYTVPDTIFWYEPDSITVLGKKGDKVDVYVALQVGQWMDQGSGIVNSFDFKYDSFVLLGPPEESTGVPSRKADPIIRVYPNPVSDDMTVLSNYVLRSITVSNVVGQKVKYLDQLNRRLVKLDLSGLENGLYFITTEDVNGQIHTAKVMKR